ncbi:hypothetical protein CTAYLR_005289 [Chrysophaeum taylorii]|uniref:Sulfotransferase n=1 Tax=Chrysophaeum taylorii TaxID=2483200 RepID=A0AAD7UKL3_9STRA|nr:hypothetical protein CTAYLR_005289 [Chrysophaeum taylorii]
MAGLVGCAAGLGHEINPWCARNDDLFTKTFAQKSFDSARSELGLGPAVLPSTWETFFNYKPHTCTKLELPTTCMVYQTILKCGNNAIRASLLNGTRSLHLDAQDFVCREWPDIQCLKDKPVMRWTFVREPLSHYISGYGEYMYREYVHRDNYVNADQKFEEIRAKVRDKDQPLAYVLNQISGPHWLFEHSVNAKHMSLMSGVARERDGEPPLQYVGHLSNADEEWTELFEIADVTESVLENLRLNKELGPHMSSLDQIGARGELRQILLTNSTIRRGLCRLLERDYVCFNYDFEACLDGSALIHSH